MCRPCTQLPPAHSSAGWTIGHTRTIMPPRFDGTSAADMVDTAEPTWITEAERQTRLRRIDPRLILAGWLIVDFDPIQPTANYRRHAVREYPPENGPADYVLWVDGQPLGIVEVATRPICMSA